MTIEVKTALEGCASHCPRFKVRVINLYENNGIYYRAYQCEHIDECEAMLKALSTVTVENYT